MAVTLSSAQEALKKTGQQPFPSSHDSLKMALTVRASQQSYRMDDKVPLEVQLTNAGAGTLFLFDDVCWNPGNVLTMHVFTADGKEVSGKSDYLRDCLPPPPRRNDISPFIRLEPRTFYGVVADFTARELVPNPGDYDIVVRYEAALFKRLDSQIWRSEASGALTRGQNVSPATAPTPRVPDKPPGPGSLFKSSHSVDSGVDTLTLPWLRSVRFCCKTR